MHTKVSTWSRAAFPSAAMVGLALTLVLGGGPVGRAGAAGPKKPVVLVAPFENQTRHHEFIPRETASGAAPGRPLYRYSVDRYAEAPRSLLEDTLGQVPGIQIAERQRVDALLLDKSFGSRSRLIDTESALRLGKMVGANLIVLGSLVDIRNEVKEFAGYGVSSRITQVVCKARVRVLNPAGAVLYTKMYTGSMQYDQSNFGGKGTSDANFAAIEEALKEVEKDDALRNVLLGEKPSSAAAATGGLVEIEFAPKPENCDVEIDGRYVGGSPVKRKLPAGKEIKVKISKGGYVSWEGVIVPEAGLRITREMEKSR